MEGGDGGEGHREEGSDAVLPVLAFEAAGQAVAIAMGVHLRVYDCKTNTAATLKDETALGPHTDVVRSIAFSLCGRWMATGGDDKLFKLWECATWTCKWTMCACLPAGINITVEEFAPMEDGPEADQTVADSSPTLFGAPLTDHLMQTIGLATITQPVVLVQDLMFFPLNSRFPAPPPLLFPWRSRQPKKVCAVAFCSDSQHVLFANKFGDVNVCPVDPSGAAPEDDPELLFGHWCSVITSLSCTQDGRYVVTSDRDNKVRVSILPPPGQRMGGAHEVQAFCLGHTSFVTSTATVPGASGDPEGVLSGSGDGTLRLWDPRSGVQLAQLKVAAPVRQEGAGAGAGAGQATASGAGTEAKGAGEGEAVDPPVVTAVAVTRNGVAAAIVEGSLDVILLTADPKSRSLALAGSVRLPGHGIPPSTIAFSPEGVLWAASGAVIGGEPKLLLAAVRVTGASAESVALPQGMLDALLGAGHDAAAAADALMAAAGAAASVSAALRKRKYDATDVVRV